MLIRKMIGFHPIDTYLSCCYPSIIIVDLMLILRWLIWSNKVTKLPPGVRMYPASLVCIIQCYSAGIGISELGLAATPILHSEIEMWPAKQNTKANEMKM